MTNLLKQDGFTSIDRTSNKLIINDKFQNNEKNIFLNCVCFDDIY